ncbi:hypothetical protein JCM10449v2_003526 [Rhodotorula kratochvilovae]
MPCRAPEIDALRPRDFPSSSATLLDLPDEILIRIFREISTTERNLQMSGWALLDPLVKGFPRLDRYRRINRRLQRVVRSFANRLLFLPQHDEDDIRFVEGEKGEAVEQLDVGLRDEFRAYIPLFEEPKPCPPYTFRLFGLLPNLTTLRISSLFPFPRSGCEALEALPSLETLDLSIVRHVEDEQFNIGRDLRSLRHLTFAVTGEHNLASHPWLDNGLCGLEELDVHGGLLEPKPDWESLQALTVHTATTVEGRGEWLAKVLRSLGADLTAAADFALKRLAFSCVHAEFFLELGDTESFDNILRHLAHARVKELEIQFKETFRCDEGTDDVEVRSVKRLIITELYAPENQRANLNGLDDFILIFPHLHYLALTSHWLVPLDVAADLREDADPPTTLSIAYDAPQLAQQVIFLRDETDVREFRYRRAMDADWELRWTREGGCGTQFEVQRWWV